MAAPVLMAALRDDGVAVDVLPMTAVKEGPSTIPHPRPLEIERGYRPRQDITRIYLPRRLEY